MGADRPKKPILFACAGCSPAGRLAYDVAQELDRRGVAEMSCLAGLAARKAPFLNKVRDRAVWIVDGCPIACAQGVLDQLGIEPARNMRLDALGIRKNDPANAQLDLGQLIARLLPEAG